MNQRIYETCQVEGCDRKHKARGYCAVHYQHWKRGVPVRAGAIKTRDSHPPERCTETECQDPVKAKGLCKMHYARLLRHGHTRYRDRKTVPVACSEVGCESHAYSKGLCHQHWQRQKINRTKYGITSERVAEMLKEQDGKCAICGNVEHWRHPLSGRGQPLSVDHNHETGDVRGLLCNSCNRGLGLFGDSPERLRAAAAYLERHRST